MLQTVNLTPFATAAATVLDKEGREHWVTVVKATYAIAVDGTLSRHDDQEPVALVPVFEGEPGRSSLVRDGELVLEHPGTDIVVNGSVHAPGGKTAQRVEAECRVGDRAMRILATGDRVWQRRRGRLEASEPEPFQAMPIGWERAYGGTIAGDGTPKKFAANPVGAGFLLEADQAEDQALPNIERPDALVRDWSDRPSPAGLGAMPASWEPRARYGGTYDEAWRRERAPLLADDFDPLFHRTTPLGLFSERHLRGGEPVHLENFTPDGALGFTLPLGHLTLRSDFGQTFVDYVPVLDRIIIEPDDGKLVMVWRAALRTGTALKRLARTVVAFKPRVRVTAATAGA